MKRRYSIFALLLLVAAIGNTQIVISEIMYNAPEGGADSLEYIEIYNSSQDSIQLEGFSFSEGVEFVFPDTIFHPNSFIVVAVNEQAMMNTFGVPTLQWTDGALSNGGEDISIIDTAGTELDYVDFSPDAPWPGFSEGANGGGASIEFCLDTEDNTDPVNWKASTVASGDTINGLILRGTPGMANSATCTTAAVDTVVLSGLAFSPADVTINIGDKLLWMNQSGTHNINGSLDTYPDNPEGFFSGNPMSAPYEFSFTFTKEGVYNYQCDPHVNAGMTGTVTVINNIPNLVVTEIMYNDPSTDDLDSLEFIEIYNAGSSSVSLEGMKLVTNVINFTLPDSVLGAGEFLILQKQNSEFIAEFGLLSISWNVGGLSNNGDAISLRSSDGDIIDEVTFLDSAPWDSEADGTGRSLSLCDLNSDNNDPANWQASSTETTLVFSDTIVVFANPGAFNSCLWDIEKASSVDSDGVAIFSGVPAIIEGIAYGINYRPGGLQFTVIDENNQGIGVFSSSRDYGYTVTEGDKLRISGDIGQFNGLTQLYVDTVMMLSSGNALVVPDSVLTLGEDTESSLVVIKDVSLLDPSQWTGSGSGFNVDVSNGADTFALRIDADVVDLYENAYPTGSFNVTGIGGQFDNTSPYTSGYQLFPRYMADIDPYMAFVNDYPLKTIAEVTALNQDGTAIADGVKCELIGVTHGINLRPSGLQFTIIDENNDGIGLFLNSGNLGLEYQEGDMVSIRGSISQFNGLTQINPDSIILLSSANALVEPTVVTNLGEDTESQLVSLLGVTVEDPTQWSGDGSSFNVDMKNSQGEIFTVRIDADVELSSMTLPGTILNVTGIGGQFDSDSPYDSGYQLLPRYAADIEVASFTKDLFLSTNLVTIFPNPSSDQISIETEFEYEVLNVYNTLGQQVARYNNHPELIDVSNLSNGNYFMQFIGKEGIVSKELIKH